MNRRKNTIWKIAGAILACLCIVMVCVFQWAFTESYDYEKRSEYVEMSDGTKIAVDIYMPEDYDGEACPVIFQYTPYGRAYIVGEEQNLFEKIAYKYAVGTSSGILDRANSKDTVYGSTAEMVNMFLENGYIYVCADMRGTGASYGHKIDFSPDIATDGAELIDWMAQQSWCDGNVGMFGGSYLGYSQLVVAGQQPEALKCIIPEVVPLDGYTGEIRPGGVFLWSYSQQDLQISLEYNCYMPDSYVYPTVPVIDEDGDGDLLDEIPLDLDGDGNFLNDYNYPEDPNDEPQYADGNKREHIYYLATYDHLQNIPYSELGPNTEYIDTDWTYEGETMNSYDVSPSASLQAIKDSGIAVCLHGGWMDPFVRGTTELYNTLKDTNPTYMIIGPDYHMGTSPFWEHCGSSEEEELTAYGEKWLRFFDFYLKGIDNGLDEEDPVQIYVMNGGGWRYETEWPLSDSEGTAYYLNANGTLATDQGADGQDNYTVDFTHSSVWDNEGWSANRWLMETPGTLPYRTEMDEKCLTYTSAALTKDTEVTGHPIIDLWVSSTASTGDFYVYLEDVDEDGNAILVTEGVLNAKFHELHDNNDMILGGNSSIDVQPELPWHGYEESDADPDVFADGKIVQLTIDLFPTSWVFMEGHRIRISIACADYPTFELTPELAPTNDPNDPDNITPEITVYRTEVYASKITLPIVP